MRKLISVTQTHIDEGTPDNELCCPIALALMEAGASKVKVMKWSILFFMEPIPFTTWLPESAKRFIRRFDEGGPDNVKPFRFYVTDWAF